MREVLRRRREEEGKVFGIAVDCNVKKVETRVECLDLSSGNWYATLVKLYRTFTETGTVHRGQIQNL